MSNTQVNPIPPIVINIALLLLGTALTFVTSMYFNGRRRAEEKLDAEKKETEAFKTRLVELEGKMALVNAAVVPISTAFQAILIKELTHFHTPEMDALLVKVGPPNILTDAEQQRLKVMLQARADNRDVEIPQSERDAAHILPEVMKRAQVEQDKLNLATELKLKLVTIAEVIGIGTVKVEKTSKGES